ncbi:hypothetical protein POM88_022436 [Heracleum sosnowskyi]|uniref:Uncharacterized protein n=1 Tax=Heracleum sosnowskyi TaxID=360622 RepID=A0AAD8IGU7_9APIA|nr:hypothetical protein POM88_022436 [Heracleum sosnowskyi]
MLCLTLAMVLGGSAEDVNTPTPKQVGVLIYLRFFFLSVEAFRHEVFIVNIASNASEGQVFGFVDGGSSVRVPFKCTKLYLYCTLYSPSHFWFATIVERNTVLDVDKQEETCSFCAAHVWKHEFKRRHLGPGPKGFSICCGKVKV